MSDPLNEFFGVAPAIGAPVEDNPEPARSIEAQAINEDVTLARRVLRETLTDGAAKVSTVLEIALQMQDPDMIDSATKMMTALSKLGVDLVNIDLRVLQESKKVPAGQPIPQHPDGTEKPAGTQTQQTTADVIKAIKDLRAAERRAAAMNGGNQPIDTVEPKEPRENG